MNTWFEERRWIVRVMLQREQDKLFVFGDNLTRTGLGGQAKEMRGEPNAVGIPTKRSPSEFLHNADIKEWYRSASPDITRLIYHQGDIVWPALGIGTGLAQLFEHAPDISREIDIIKTVLMVEVYDFSRISRLHRELNFPEFF